MHAPDEAYPVLGASSDLQQVIINICNNAAFASDGRPVALSLSRERLLAERAPRWQRQLGMALIVMNLCFAPAFLTVRARDIELTKNLLDYADRSLPRNAAITHKTLVMVNPPLNALGLYFPVYRAATGLPLPAGFRYLATADEVFAELAEAIAAGDIERRIGGPVKHSGFQRLA